jgi:hypothetical protein
VLAVEAVEDPDAPIVHTDGDAEMVFPQRRAQQVPGRLVELEKAGYRVELLLGHLERVKTFDSHINTPFRMS